MRLTCEGDVVAPRRRDKPNAPSQHVIGVVQRVGVVGCHGLRGTSDYAGLRSDTEDCPRMPGQDADMELYTDKILSKERILQELTKAVKLVSTCIFNCPSMSPINTSTPSAHVIALLPSLDFHVFITVKILIIFKKYFVVPGRRFQFAHWISHRDLCLFVWLNSHIRLRLH
jgi:hypothetical protein